MGERKYLLDIGKSIVRVAPEGWTSASLILAGAGATVESRLIFSVLERVREDFGIDLQGGQAVSRLRRSMYEPGKGAWYSATIVVDRSGQLDAEFDYEGWPFGDEEMDENLRDMFIEDQELFPRPVELLPPWHPLRPT